METITSRRQFLLNGLAAAVALSFPTRLALAGETKKRNYVQIGDLQLEVVDPSDTPTPAEYADPSNTDTPLIKVPRGLLGENVTQNFKLGEFARISDPRKIKDTKIATHEYNGGVYNAFIRLDPSLPQELQTLRDALGHPLKINSPFRSATYNRKVGGAFHSRHLAGQAADVSSAGYQAVLYKLADKQFSEGGVGKYSTFVHVDTRGFRSRWRS